MPLCIRWSERRRGCGKNRSFLQERSSLRRCALALATMCGAVSLSSAPAFGAGSPWLSEPGAGSVSLSFVRQRADEKWTGEGGTVMGPMPGGELTQSTFWLIGDYAFRDNFALDAQVGFARSHLAQDMDKGLADANVGLTWRLADELIGHPLSFAVRGGVILAGGYDTGSALVTTSGAPAGIYAIGDGGNGFEASVIAGRLFAECVGVSVEVGYRNRNNDIPNNMFYSVSGLLVVNEQVTVSLDYHRVTSDGDLNIGVPPFTPDRFPEVAEETTVVGGRVSVALTESASGSLFYGDTIDGRNASASGIFGMTLSYAFGAY